MTRLTQAKLGEKRKKDRIRQAKHRAAVKANPQKFRCEKEKRKNKRLEKKAVEEEQKRRKAKVPTTVKCVLNKAKDVLKKHRSKLALVKKLLNKSDSVLDCSKTYYKRRTDRYSSTVTTYFNKVAVDVPNKKCYQKQKKVLPKRLVDHYIDFKKVHPHTKISFSTFKRRRPNNVLLAGCNKLVQCLCEKCVNVMLLMDGVNSLLKKKTRG